MSEREVPYDKFNENVVEHENRIKERAYQMWEAEGRIRGRAEHYWHRAKELIDAESQAAFPPIQSHTNRY